MSCPLVIRFGTNLAIGQVKSRLTNRLRLAQISYIYVLLNENLHSGKVQVVVSSLETILIFYFNLAHHQQHNVIKQLEAIPFQRQAAL